MRAPIAHMMRLCTRSFLKNEEERQRGRETSASKAKDEGQRRVCTYVHHRPLPIVIFQSSSSFLITHIKQFQEKKRCDMKCSILSSIKQTITEEDTISERNRFLAHTYIHTFANIVMGSTFTCA